MASDWTRRGVLGAAGAAAAVAAAEGAASAQGAGKGGKAKAIRIVGVCCSPRKGKTTAASLKVCLEAAAAVSPAVRTELIELGGMSIPGQVAAGLPLAAGQKDDFPSLVPRLADPAVAGIVVGTPVYFGNMSYLCTAFLDRCITFRRNKFALRDKVAGVLAVGGARNGGQELTVRSVQAALMSQQMLVVGDGPPSAHWGGTVWNHHKGDVTKDEFGMATVKNLGRRVAELALRLAGLRAGS